MTIRINMEKFAEIVDRMGPELEKAAILGLREAGLRLEGMIPAAIAETQPYPPQDTGELARSHYTSWTERGCVVGVDAPHAPFMEHGTRPHYPPEQPLAEWAYRKGLADSEEEAQQVARAICRKIAREGITPRHFLARAVSHFKETQIVWRCIRRQLDKVLKSSSPPDAGSPTSGASE